VTRGWIGVEAQEITPEIAESFRLASTSGVLIAGVLKGSPADRGGVKPGDILLSINAKPVTDPTAMLNIVAGLTPGKAAAVRVRRDQKDIDLPIEPGRRPPAQRRR
jgi:S1-C subfamily serine protease